MTGPLRSVYRLDLVAVPAVVAAPLGSTIRPLAATDDDALGTLMERAYAGTIDENLGSNSNGAVDIDEWRSGHADGAASTVVVDAGGRLVAASLISSADSVFLSYVITDPDWKHRGAALCAATASMQVLAERGVRVVHVGVTNGNTASERLVARLGFVYDGPV
jgi:predicted GNAT family acetyltransferase